MCDEEHHDDDVAGVLLACGGEVAADPKFDARGEVFPVAILFGGVLLTILIGVHVVLDSMARSATQSAADYGAAAAKAVLPGSSSCGNLTPSYAPASEPECQGVLAAQRSMWAATASVTQTRLPTVVVDQPAGVVRVTTFGGWISPVLGTVEVRGTACVTLDHVGVPIQVPPGSPTPPTATFQC